CGAGFRELPPETQLTDRIQHKRALPLLRFFLLVLAAVSLPLPAVAAQGASSTPRQIDGAGFERQEPTQLERDTSVERELSAHGSHDYRIFLTPGEFLKVEVEECGIDIMVAVYSPAGDELWTIDHSHDLQGKETISVLPEQTGDYRFRVRAAAEQILPGHYLVRVSELRPSVPEDRVAVAAQRAFGEAERLKEEGTAKAMRRAIPHYEKALQSWKQIGDVPGAASGLDRLGEVHYRLG